VIVSVLSAPETKVKVSLQSILSTLLGSVTCGQIIGLTIVRSWVRLPVRSLSSGYYLHVLGDLPQTDKKNLCI